VARPSLGGVVADPLQRNAEGGGLLFQAMSREANILAYNDAFRFVAVLALATAGALALVLAHGAIRRMFSLGDRA
jgi:hypothetical protein